MADPAEPDKTLDPLEEAGRRVVGHYRLLRRLGAGGMGEVFLAEDITLKRTAAVKLLPAEVANDSAWRKRFLHEARTASALNHPSIATIYEAGAEGGIAYIAMEYVEGETLRERLKRPLALKEAVAIGRQVAQALAVAHGAGVVHHDIKPANIMLPPGGGVKVLDFGLARRQRASGDKGETATAATLSGGGISGTPGYAAPEQLQPGLPGAREKTDARADLFALGAVLYEMLSGRPAFQGKNLFELCNAVLTETLPPADSLRQETPSALARVVARCLEKEPTARYQCAADLALDLALAASETPAPALAQPAVRRHSAWFLVAAVVLGVALVGSALLWRRPQRTYWKLPASAPKPVLRHSGIIQEAGLAPDGSQFAYVFQNELYLQSLEGGEPRKLTDDGLAKSWPRFSPDGKRLVFERAAPLSLYLLDLSAGIPRLLLEDASKGVWSPDGRKLAFIRPSTREAFVANEDGKKPLSLGPSDTWVLNGVSWAPDGKKLAIRHKNKIYIVSADGSSRKVVPGINDVLDVAFTPDGDFLLVMKPTGGQTHQLYQAPVRGGTMVPFLVGRYDASSVTFSRDGKKLLAIVVRGESDIVVSGPAPEAVQSKVQQITSTGDTMYDLALSPNEKRIAYLRWWGAGRYDLWMVNVDGADPREITRGVKPRNAAWSPDGKRIVFSGGEEQIWTVRLDEGTPRPFPTVEGKKSHPSYSADAKYIVFGLQRDGKSDVWLVPVDGGQGTALTLDGISKMPRAAPAGTGVAYLRELAASSYELRIVDYVSRRDRAVVTREALAKFGELRRLAARWSRDGRYLFLSTASGLLRVKADNGSLEKFSFPIGLGAFEVFSDYRKIVFQKENSNVQPWLYDDLQ